MESELGADVVLYAPTDELTDTEHVVVGELRAHPHENPAEPKRRRRRRRPTLEEPALDLYGGYDGLLVRTCLIRSEKYDDRDLPLLATMDAVVEIVRHLAYADQEHLVTISLDAANRARAIHETAIGGTSGVGQQPLHVVKVAVLTTASAVIIVHNHPSGVSRPSSDDITMTKAVAESLICVGITLLDHIVIARDGAASIFDFMERPRMMAAETPTGAR